MDAAKMYVLYEHAGNMLCSIHTECALTQSTHAPVISCIKNMVALAWCDLHVLCGHLTDL